MVTPKPNANGHRRRELVRRVKAEETHCALCGDWVDKSLTFSPGVHGPKCPQGECTGCVPHPKRGEVDEDIPRSKGGSPYYRPNCHLMCRQCNQFKSDRTLAEARLLWLSIKPQPKVTASPIW